MTKLYRFIQTLNNYTEPYYQMEGGLEEVIDKWVKGPYPQYTGEYFGYSIDNYNSLFFQVLGRLSRQGVFVEIVDDNVYGLGWTTKIEEIEE